MKNEVLKDQIQSFIWFLFKIHKNHLYTFFYSELIQSVNTSFNSFIYFLFISSFNYMCNCLFLIQFVLVKQDESEENEISTVIEMHEL